MGRRRRKEEKREKEEEVVEEVEQQRGAEGDEAAAAVGRSVGTDETSCRTSFTSPGRGTRNREDTVGPSGSAAVWTVRPLAEVPLTGTSLEGFSRRHVSRSNFTACGQ